MSMNYICKSKYIIKCIHTIKQTKMKAGYKEIIEGCPGCVQASTKETAPLFNLNGMVVAARVWQIYDGDSAYMSIALHGKAVSFKIRTQHIDSAEMRTRDPIEKELAMSARDRVRALIDGKICCVSCFKDDKYGRTLVDITTDGGEDVASLLLREKLAFPYGGGTKNNDWGALHKAREQYIAQTG